MNHAIFMPCADQGGVVVVFWTARLRTTGKVEMERSKLAMCSCSGTPVLRALKSCTPKLELWTHQRQIAAVPTYQAQRWPVRTLGEILIIFQWIIISDTLCILCQTWWMVRVAWLCPRNGLQQLITAATSMSDSKRKMGLVLTCYINPIFSATKWRSLVAVTVMVIATGSGSKDRPATIWLLSEGKSFLARVHTGCLLPFQAFLLFGWLVKTPSASQIT